MLTFALTAPSGPALEFVVLFAVLLLGPVVVQQARLPGIIGLLFGGFLIGPHALGLISSGDQTVPDLGQLGLLYLMFVAGVELDLHLLRDYRRAAVTFGVTTFTLPFLGGVAVGILEGWSIPSTLLLGSLLASHTLILQPTIRDAGLSDNPAIASAIGATVLTDTLALVVLAGVAGTQTGSGSVGVLLLEIALGLVVLVAVGLLVLPRVAEYALRLWGGDRLVRYLLALVSFLFMAMLAEVFGIEGIVGAFFAGLALNQLVPNEGPSMERIEFFGSVFFIPVFLVSVGLLINPSVMFTASTLGLAALLCAACVGGKALAAASSRPVLGFSWAECGVMFALTTPQAAATLAATLVGFNIGLFGVSVVNAVLVLILVSILLSTAFAQVFIPRVEKAPPRHSLGQRVLVVAPATGPSPRTLRAAERLARSAGGVVDVVIPHTELTPSEATLRALERQIYRSGFDGEVTVGIGRDAADSVGIEARRREASIVVVDPAAGIPQPVVAQIAAQLRVPLVVLYGGGIGRMHHIRLVGNGQVDGADAAAELAQRLSRGDLRHVDAPDGAEPGALTIVRARTTDDLARTPSGHDDSLLAWVIEPATATR